MSQYERDLKQIVDYRKAVKAVESEVVQGVNLKENLKGINITISNMQDKIDCCHRAGLDPSGFVLFPAELYYLVEEIMKRL